MSTDHEQPDDPRAHWRVLPQTVSPTDDGVQTQTTAAAAGRLSPGDPPPG
ncbi:hypothetical protein HQ305_08865 [Rhodococcus sp. BP-149]|nr:hypothetical protein [Rhodococcus sp. BP-160]MBY6686191.1 hypothetical protein [Rhodococcus sp. BP-288]MBY6710880.1 hypothetical protein [Rhodococcus sp. BP-160]MBY6724154.1 hypothetical protein [Rhodococcus sp. BP-149]